MNEFKIERQFRHKMIIGLKLLLAHLMAASVIVSAPVSNEKHELRQPDGSLVTVLVSGDEYYQDVETPDGYTLIRDPQTGWICYAKLSNDKNALISTGIVYGNRDALSKSNMTALAGVSEHARINSDALFSIRKQRYKELNGMSVDDAKQKFLAKALPKQMAVKVDTVYGLTILVNFPDTKSAISIDSITSFLNMPGYKSYKNNGSVRDFYYDVSAGHLVYLQQVIPFITANNNKSYYDRTDGSGYAGSDELVSEIFNKLKSNGTSSQIYATTASATSKVLRAVNILYAGSASAGWAQGLWPHSGYTNASIGTFTVQRYMLADIGNSLSLGTFCHENGHMLCSWPDLYAYDDHSSGAGMFDLMCQCGTLNPPPPGAYLRSLLGWMDIMEISKDTPGRVYKVPANSNIAFFYSGSSSTSANELFCIEARRRTGRSATLPDDGLIIWHIDKKGDNTETGKNDYAMPEQADGKNDLEKKVNLGDANDLFAAPTAAKFSDSTKPSAIWHNGTSSGMLISNISTVSDTMTFTLGNKITAVNVAANVKVSAMLAFDKVSKELCYTLPASSDSKMVTVDIGLYSINGQLVKQLLHKRQLRGTSYEIDMSRYADKRAGLSSGSYLCKLNYGTDQKTLPLIW